MTAIGNFGVVQTVDVTVASGTLLTIDLPFNGATVSQPFHLAGWSFDPGDPNGTGVDTIHVWAYPLSAPGSPTFVGLPVLGGSRPEPTISSCTRTVPSRGHSRRRRSFESQ